MHFNFELSAAQVLWTLTFAALLVLLVVLLGRDRARRFPWFTASIALMGVLLLTTQLLLSKMSRFTGTEIFLVLSNLEVVVSLLVLVELARRSFRGMGRLGWIIGTLVIVAIGAAVVVFWGPGPAWKTLTATSELATIRLMDLAVDKGILFSSVVTVELGLMITLLGRSSGPDGTAMRSVSRLAFRQRRSRNSRSVEACRPSALTRIFIPRQNTSA